jgi:hypothetical protein
MRSETQDRGVEVCSGVVLLNVTLAGTLLHLDFGHWPFTNGRPATVGGPLAKMKMS